MRPAATQPGCHHRRENRAKKGCLVGDFKDEMHSLPLVPDAHIGVKTPEIRK
jgi:hypothetical protein